MLELGDFAAEAAAAESQLGMISAASVFGLEGNRAAQCVEAKQRIRTRHQRNFRDGDSRDEVPTHDIAEGLVEADSVHVDGDALGRTEERRGGVAAVVDVGLIGVALHFVDMDAAEAFVQKIGQVQSAAVLDVALIRGLDRQGNLCGRQIGSGERSCSDDVNPERLGAQG